MAVPECICGMLACLVNHPKRIRTSVKLYLFYLRINTVQQTKAWVIIFSYYKVMFQETANCILEICGVQFIFHMKSSFDIWFWKNEGKKWSQNNTLEVFNQALSRQVYNQL